MNTYEIHFQNETLTSEEAVRRLKTMAFQGLEKRFPAPAPELKDRIDHELAYIAQTGDLLQYLVILLDVTRYAREHQFYIWLSSEWFSKSLTAFCLGITAVDPIRYDLPFDSSPSKGVYNLVMVPKRAKSELDAYWDQVYPEEFNIVSSFYEVSRIDMALQLIEERFGQREKVLLALDSLGETEEASIKKDVKDLSELTDSFWFPIVILRTHLHYLEKQFPDIYEEVCEAIKKEDIDDDDIDDDDIDDDIDDEDIDDDIDDEDIDDDIDDEDWTVTLSSEAKQQLFDKLSNQVDGFFARKIVDNISEVAKLLLHLELGYRPYYGDDDGEDDIDEEDECGTDNEN